MTAPVLVIPDWNVFLHALMFDQLPWRELVGAEAVEIVLVRQVLRELDAKKHGESDKLRHRAQRVLSRIREWVPSAVSRGELADGVSASSI